MKHSAFILMYTDPGTGAMLWQLLVAAFIGGAFYFRHYVTKLKVLFSASKAKNKRN